MFHIGHLNILQRARAQCDYLIAGVSTDELVVQDKHKLPVIPFCDRFAILQALRCVDEVVAQPDKNKLAAWERLHFNKMFVGSDWKGTDAWKQYEAQLCPLGVEIVYLPYTEKISSTLLRNRLIVRYQLGSCPPVERIIQENADV